jgi:Dullard-like phosphatase family protein
MIVKISVVNDQPDPTKQIDTIEGPVTGDQPYSTEPTAAIYATMIDDQPEFTMKQPYKSDLIVLLDIDHTMVFSQFFDTEAEAQAYINRMPTDSKSKTVDYVQAKGFEDGSVVHVNQRPGLKEFLHEIGTTFETHIFTAGSRGYAHGIAKALDPEGMYFGDRIWCDQHCKRRSGELYKDLSALPLGRGMDRVVLIDDNVTNLRANPSNTIKVKDFKDDPNDKELEKVLATLKSFQDSTVDVRPILRNEKKKWTPLGLPLCSCSALK